MTYCRHHRPSTLFTPENIYLNEATGRWYHDGIDVTDVGLWWRCPSGHSFAATLGEQTSGGLCPTCPTCTN